MTDKKVNDKLYVNDSVRKKISDRYLESDLI